MKKQSPGQPRVKQMIKPAKEGQMKPSRSFELEDINAKTSIRTSTRSRQKGKKGDEKRWSKPEKINLRVATAENWREAKNS